MQYSLESGSEQGREDVVWLITVVISFPGLEVLLLTGDEEEAARGSDTRFCSRCMTVVSQVITK